MSYAGSHEHLIFDEFVNTYSSNGFEGEVVEYVGACHQRGELEIKDQVFVEFMVDDRQERGHRPACAKDLEGPARNTRSLE